MEIKITINRLSEVLKQFTQTITQLRTIQKLEQDMPGSAAAIADSLKKCDISGLTSEIFKETVKEIEVWKQDYQDKLQPIIEDEGRRFGSKLEDGLRSQGIQTIQKGRAICAGLFLIEWDLGLRTATIWFGPKKEEIEKVRMDTGLIISHIEALGKKLGSNFTPEEFLDRLKTACAIVSQEENSEYASLHKVLLNMALLVQDKRFQNKPTRENYRNYLRYDLSYDLFRSKQIGAQRGLHMRTAVRQQTMNPKAFLWVPTNESVDGGNHFSGFKFEETRR